MTASFIQASEVHIWHAPLDRPSTSIEPLAQLLSPDEQQRADRFRFEKDRKKFIIARGLLRTILSQYLEISPEKVHFSYGLKGKPELVPPSPISFNVSHSHQMALYAITLHHRIGIDLEYVRPIEAASLAQRFFSPQEAAVITALTDTDQHRAFFRGWTQKEAYLKATGDGLIGLQSVEVSLALDKPMEIIKIGDDPQAASHWFVHEILIPDYVAALALDSTQYSTQPTIHTFLI
jgi:4'-phosphopantetheinyl transferase